MNISAPPTNSRGNANASRTNSLVGNPVKPLTSSRSSSQKSVPLAADYNGMVQQHGHSLSLSSPLGHNSRMKSARNNNLVHQHAHGSTGNLLRLGAEDPLASKSPPRLDTKMDSSHSLTKSSEGGFRSLTLDSSKKLDDFLNNVKLQQLKQHQASPAQTPPSMPFHVHQKHPSLARALPSSKSLKHMGNTWTSESPQEIDKKRLVKQFYEDARTASKGTNTPARTNSLTASDELLSSVSPRALTDNVFNEYQLEPSSNPKEAASSDTRAADGPKTSTIDAELLDLKFQVINEVKIAINQSEFYALGLLNTIEKKRQDLKALTDQLAATYRELSKDVLHIDESSYNKYSSEEKLDYSDTLNSAETDLQKYRNIIADEKSLISDIDEDLKHLELFTMRKIQRSRSNRNRFSLIVLVLSVIYMCYRFI